MGINRDTIVKKRELYGALFENMRIVDVIKNLCAQGKRPMLTFFRDSNQNEIDLIVELDGKIIPIEIKASKTMNNDFFNTLSWFKETTKNDQKSIVIYGDNQQQIRSNGNAMP